MTLRERIAANARRSSSRMTYQIIRQIAYMMCSYAIGYVITMAIAVYMRG